MAVFKYSCILPPNNTFYNRFISPIHYRVKSIPDNGELVFPFRNAWNCHNTHMTHTHIQHLQRLIKTCVTTGMLILMTNAYKYARLSRVFLLSLP